jgi:hypothetical protein
MRVLATAQQTHGHDGAEVLRIGRAAVRRVADYGQNLAPGRVHQHRLGRSGLQKIRHRHCALHQSSLILARLATAV